MPVPSCKFPPSSASERYFHDMPSLSLAPTPMFTTSLPFAWGSLEGFPSIPVDNTLGAWFIGAFFSVL